MRIKQFLTKMGNEIKFAYLMPTKYKIFLGKGALPHYNPRQGTSPWTPANTSLTDRVLPTSMCKGNESLREFKIGGSMDSLVEMVCKWRIHYEVM